MKSVFVCYLVLLILLVTLNGCSHLHVDIDSRWQLAHDAQLLIQMDDPPDEITSEQISTLITQLGWTVTEGSLKPDAQLLCRWLRAVDLTEDSEPTTVIKSFHAKIVADDSGRVLGVADYFYPRGEAELWPGVEHALSTLHQRLVARQVVPHAEVRPVALVEQPLINPQPEVAASALSMADKVPAEPARSVVIRRTDPDGVDESTVGEQRAGHTSKHPEAVEVSPWVPRFQGMGFEPWSTK